MVQRSLLSSLCSGNKFVGRHTSCSERSRQRTGSPRVLSTPFHAFTCAREARLVRVPFHHHQYYHHHCCHYHYHHSATTTITTTTPSLSAPATLVVLLNYYRLYYYHHYQQHRRPDVAADTTSLSLTSFDSKTRHTRMPRWWGIHRAGKDPVTENGTALAFGVGVGASNSSICHSILILSASQLMTIIARVYVFVLVYCR